MATNIVFLVHGMGRNLAVREGTTPAWSDEVIAAFDKVWASFPALDGIARADVLELVPITYDQVFREYLSQVGDSAQRLRQYMPDNLMKEVFDVLAGAGRDETDFFWNNIADVLDYQYGADRFRRVHEVINLAITKKVREVRARPKHENATFSVVAHSLGTAAAHGALNRLGGGNLGESAAFRLGGAFRFRSYTSIANLSRLLWHGTNDIYRGTIVRPFSVGQGRGYVDTFINVRHFTDPIPAPRPFGPTDWGSAYSNVNVRHVRNLNVHGFAHYLEHPAVTGNIVRSILGDAFLGADDVAQACTRYPDVALTDPQAKQAVTKLIDDVGKALLETFGNDQAPASSVPKLVALTLRDLWKHISAIKPLLNLK